MDAVRSRRPAFLFLLLIALVVGACTSGAAAPATESPPGSAPAAAEPSPEPSAFPLALTDYTGTDVEIAEEPRSIVSLTPAATETLFAIGAGDRVTGKVEDIANQPAEAADVPVVGTFAGVDVEAIVALEPDLIIAGGQAGTPDDVIEQLRGLDLPVVVVYAEDLDEVFADIELIGEAAGEPEAARELTASMRSGFDDVEAATAGVDRPRVFYETGDQPAIYGVADDSFIASMLELAGAEPVTTGSSTSWEMPQEELVAADPEVIVLGDSNYGVTAEAVAARPGWGKLTAVRDGRIHPIDDIVVTRPGPRLLEGIRALVGVIHPDVEMPASSETPAASSTPVASPVASGG